MTIVIRIFLLPRHPLQVAQTRESLKKIWDGLPSKKMDFFLKVSFLDFFPV